VSVKTIEWYKLRFAEKLNLRDRVDIVRLRFAAGLACGGFWTAFRSVEGRNAAKLAFAENALGHDPGAAGARWSCTA